MNQISRYRILCSVIEQGSFTRAAEEFGYTQSAISQIIRALEAEMDCRLIDRRKDGIRLTPDGEEYYPYIQGIRNAEDLLEHKRLEMQGLSESTIRILTFTSVSRNLLPSIMKSFKAQYPGVGFRLKQGDYNTARDDVLSGEVDLAFISSGARDALKDLESVFLYEDNMVAVLPEGHPLARKKVISLADMVDESFILLDEGEDYNTALNAFRNHGLEPQVEYDVYDDYTILAMIRQGFGVSILFRRVVTGFEDGVVIRELAENPVRNILLTWRDWDTLPKAARLFAEYIQKNI